MNLEYYRALPYTRRSEFILKDKDDGSTYWMAWIEELPECKAYGEDLPDAMLNLDIAFDDFINGMLHFNCSISVPDKEPIHNTEPTVISKSLEIYDFYCLDLTKESNEIGITKRPKQDFMRIEDALIAER